MNNTESATMFVNAIKKFAGKPDNIDNLESYLSRHFDQWLIKFANTPENIAVEMKQFAEMEI
jgi:hypothetical protein